MFVPRVERGTSGRLNYKAVRLSRDLIGVEFQILPTSGVGSSPLWLPGLEAFASGITGQKFSGKRVTDLGCLTCRAAKRRAPMRQDDWAKRLTPGRTCLVEVNTRVLKWL